MLNIPKPDEDYIRALTTEFNRYVKGKHPSEWAPLRIDAGRHVYDALAGPTQPDLDWAMTGCHTCRVYLDETLPRDTFIIRGRD